MNNPLTQYRSENNLSLEALGVRIGVNKSTVLRWEEGRIPAERVPEIAKKTGIPKEKLRPDIFTDKGRAA